MINLGHDIIKSLKNGKINHITLQVLYNIRGDFLNLDGEIVDTIISISKKYKGINKVVLFGSRARGDNELKSDIDLAVYADCDIFEFIEEIENTSPTLLEFDFSNMRRIDDELFIEQVEKEGVILYEKYRV